MTTLRDLLGTQAVQSVDAPWHDIGGYPLGRPRCRVLPSDIQQVKALVGWARAQGVKLVPVGNRSAYWWPMDLDGAVAVSMVRMAAVEIKGDAVRIGAGATIRDADDALRVEGLCLPIRPDNFGDSLVGSMVATATSAGVGMGRGPLSRWIHSVEVVLGTGQVLHTGASGARGHELPFARDGAPDLTGLFLGAEGGLGIVTSVVLEAAPAPWRVHLSGAIEDPASLVSLGRRLGRMGLYDTFRVRKMGREPWQVDLWTMSLVGPMEASSRARRVSEVLASCGCTTTSDAPTRDPHWEGPRGSLADRYRDQSVIGVEVVTAYDGLLERIRDARRLAAEQEASAMHTGTAVYFAPAYTSVGCFAEAKRGEEGPIRAMVDRLRLEWAKQRLIPYRTGRTWPVDSFDEVTRQRWRDLRLAMDPDGVFAPTHPLWSVAEVL
jgi:FAD/FMN-containing dehydrogenase